MHQDSDPDPGSPSSEKCSDISRNKSILERCVSEKPVNLGDFKFNLPYNHDEPIAFEEDKTECTNDNSIYLFFRIKKILFPDGTPLHWFGIHLVLFYIYFIFSPISKSIPYEESFSYVKVIRFYPETWLLWSYFISNIIVYLLTMMVRMIFLFLATNFIKFRSFFGLVLSRSFDPELSYLIWTVTMYILTYTLLIKEGDIYTIKPFNAWVRKKWVFDDRAGTWVFAIQKLYVMFSIRYILHSNCMLLFELKFVSNFASELGCYLEKYHLLRAFNLAWLSHISKRAKHNSIHGEKLKGIINTLAATDPTKNLEYKDENFFSLDPDLFSFFRSNHILKLKYFKQSKFNDWDEFQILNNIPTIKSKRDHILIWNTIEFIVNNPPYISLVTNNVKLVDSASIKIGCSTLFNQISQTCELFKQTREPNLSKNQEIDIPFGTSDEFDTNSEGDKNIDIAISDVQLNFDTIVRFLPPSFAAKFINSYDLSGHGYVTLHMFTRNVAYLTKMRIDLISNLMNQKSIITLVRRIFHIILGFVLSGFGGLIMKISSNVVLPSTIGFFSTIILVFSYMYTKFITAIMFIILSCPYHVGDRVRVDNSEPMYVKNIHTYITEFECIHGKTIIYQNAILSTMEITNETRSFPAFLQLDINIGAGITPATLKSLKQNISYYISYRPWEFVKDSCEFFGKYLEPGHIYKLTVRAQCIVGWSQAIIIARYKKGLYDFIIHQCKTMGIGYYLPPQNIMFATPLSIIK